MDGYNGSDGTREETIKPSEIDRSTLLSMAAELPTAAKPSPRGKPMSFMRAILGECMCEPFPFTDTKGFGQSSQFVELHGVECISLGAVVDELSPDQRIRETLEQLTAEPKRMISIGYLVDNEEAQKTIGNNKITETIDLDVWRKNYPDDKVMSKPVAQIIKHIEVTIYMYTSDYVALFLLIIFVSHIVICFTLLFQQQARQFGAALASFEQDLERQKAHPNRHNNAYLAGITAHNMAVVYLFAGQSEKALVLFEEAVELKRASFGSMHPHVANSLVEIGIQLFAQEKFMEAMSAFQESKQIRLKAMSPQHPLIAMVLNNIACCDFLLKNNLESLAAFQEASNIQHDALGSTARADLDLLHAAITLCNFGYMKLRIKQYEEAQAVFEQALLVSRRAMIVCTVLCVVCM